MVKSLKVSDSSSDSCPRRLPLVLRHAHISLAFPASRFPGHGRQTHTLLERTAVAGPPPERLGHSIDRCRIRRDIRPVDGRHSGRCPDDSGWGRRCNSRCNGLSAHRVRGAVDGPKDLRFVIVGIVAMALLLISRLMVVVGLTVIVLVVRVRRLRLMGVAVVVVPALRRMSRHLVGFRERLTIYRTVPRRVSALNDSTSSGPRREPGRAAPANKPKMTGLGWCLETAPTMPRPTYSHQVHASGGSSRW